MNKIILFLIIGFFSTVLTFFQFKYLNSSFSIENDGVVSPLKVFRLLPRPKPQVLNKNIYYQNEQLRNKNYTLSFFIKTRASNAPLFNSGSAKGGGSVFWNVNLVDGKIETGRVDAIAPVLVNYEINDDKWHQVVIQTGQSQSIYIDNNLTSRMSTRINDLKDRWFNFTLEPNRENPEPIQLKEVVFLNQSASIEEIESFYRKGDFLTEFILFSVVTFLTLNFLILFLLWYIRKKYPLEKVNKITEKLGYGLLIFIPGALLMWTDYYTNKILFLAIMLFLFYLTRFYKNLLPESLYLFINLPLSFFSASIRLVYSRNLRKLVRHIFIQQPSAYLLILIFLGALFIL